MIICVCVCVCAKTGTFKKEKRIIILELKIWTDLYNSYIVMYYLLILLIYVSEETI